MKVETTKEKVLQLANQFPETKEKLKILFPEVFEEDKYFDLYDMNGGNRFISGFSSVIWVRRSGEYMHKAFYLDRCINWELKEDSEGCLCLIPTKKQ